jgi:hypothetical protein
LRDPATGRSLTPLPSRQDRVPGPAPADLVLAGRGDRVEPMGLVARVVLVPRRLVGRAGPVELVLAGRGDRVELMGLVAPGRRPAPVVLHLADRVELGPVDRELPDLMGRVDLRDLAVRVVLVAMRPADLAAPADRVELTSRVDRVDRVELTSRVDRVELTSRVDRVELTSRVDRADRAVLEAPVDLAGLALTGRVALADRHRRRTSNTVSTTGVARSGAAPGTHRTDSARRITAHRRRRGNTALGGTTGRLLEVRRLTGTAHRLLVVGTGRRLLAAGTVDGMGRLATSVWHRPISGRLPTAASTPYRSSIRFSVGGASGSSGTGYRCTDLTARSPD